METEEEKLRSDIKKRAESMAGQDRREAKVIVATDGKHVGLVVDNGAYVWHSPGAGVNKPIKRYSFEDFVKYVMPSYMLRK